MSNIENVQQHIARLESQAESTKRQLREAKEALKKLKILEFPRVNIPIKRKRLSPYGLNEGTIVSETNGLFRVQFPEGDVVFLTAHYLKADFEEKLPGFPLYPEEDYSDDQDYN